jgi:hypothetical protein
MQSEWTETLTVLVKPDDLEDTGDRIQSSASDLDLAINEIKIRQRRSWTMIRLDVSLTGSADRISDFQEIFAGEGWTTLPEGSLLDPFLNDGVQASHNWLRRKRGQRRAARAVEEDTQ